MIKKNLKLMLAGMVIAWAFAAVDLQFASADAATKTTRPVVVFGTQMTPNPVFVGESTLTRTDDGITLHLTVDDVPAGVYTGWIPIFGPNGPIVAGRVAGHVVGEGGKLTFTARLKEGVIIEGHPVFPSGSLEDARGQDIGMVVRYHGLPEPGFIYEQTHTFEPFDAFDAFFTRHNAP